MTDPLTEAKIAEAANAAAIAREAEHNAIMQAVTSAIRDAMSPEKGRYIDVSRVPLICQSLIGLDKKMDEMVTQDQFWPVKTLVYGFVGLVLIAVVGALIAIVVISPR